jgi:hypothetical protein
VRCEARAQRIESNLDPEIQTDFEHLFPFDGILDGGEVGKVGTERHDQRPYGGWNDGKDEVGGPFIALKPERKVLLLDWHNWNLDREIRTSSTEEDPVDQRLRSLSGVGPVTSWMLRAEIGRFECFNVSLLGLATLPHAIKVGIVALIEAVDGECK